MRHRQKIIIFFAALILLSFLNSTALGMSIRGKFLSLIRPITTHAFLGTENVTNTFQSILHVTALIKENKNLYKELAVKDQELVTLRQENEDLKRIKKAEEFEQRYRFNLMPARIIARATPDTDITFVIDRGSNDGVAAKQIVVGDHGVLLGRITQVGPQFAIFRFITDEKSRFTAAISTQDGAIGEVRGKLGSSIMLELIPRDISVKPGDQVVTAGLENGVPQNLLIGDVIEVFEDPQNPLQRALLRPGANVADLNIVFIIQNMIP